MSKDLIIAVGGYGAGKTTFAKWYAKKRGGVYLDAELLYSEGFDVFLKRLTTIIEKSSSELFVMDGPNTSVPALSECKIQLCMCFAAPHVVYARQSFKAPHINYLLPISEEVIKLNTYHRFNMVTKDSNSLFVDTTDGFHFVTREDFPQRWEELIFCSNLSKTLHDKYYGDIELPSGVVVPGYTKSHKTWDRLKCLIDFQDKSVLDLGCFHGYFSFKAEESEAQNITGIEADESTLEVAKQVAALRKSKVLFRKGNINNLGLSYTYDIVLVLNVLHHAADVSQTLENIFKSGKQIVFEIPTTQRKVISRYAKAFGFELVNRANSHREGREMMVFANTQVSTRVLPAKYEYNYEIARLKKLPGEVLVSLVWKLEVYQPFKWLMRKYRSRRDRRVKRLVYRSDASSGG